MRCLVALLLLAGCGFHFIGEGLPSRYDSIMIPYPEGDQHGHLANELVREVGRSGAFRYSKRNGELTLLVRIKDIHHKQIGFRRDVDATDSYTKRILPSEGRVVAYAEVELIETGSGKAVFRPVVVRASADYDHDYYTTKDRAFRFSLGQLDDIHVAEQQAMEPLYRALAKRIVDFLTDVR